MNSNQEILNTIIRVLPADMEIYLVGGAVRDRLLNRDTCDLDFVVSRDAIKVGRQIANSLKAAFFPLDEDRDTARVIQYSPDGVQQVLDFASFRSTDIEGDLRERDFTINAMAFELRDEQTLLDPTGGLSDLRARVIRVCSSDAFVDDPLRILRAVRLGVALKFNILPETTKLMREATDLLTRVSPERIRDELFRMLRSDDPVSCIRIMDALGNLQYVLPELLELKGVSQTLPHHDDVWSHTLNVTGRLVKLIDGLSVAYNPEASANWVYGFFSLQLGRYRQQIDVHMKASITANRSIRSLLLLSALYHDIGKPATLTEGDDGRIRFYEHELVGSEMVSSRGRSLQLSNNEISYLKTVVRNHMRPLSLLQIGADPSRRAVYRFFRDTGLAGIDICLLSLADTLATYGPSLPKDLWADHLSLVRRLFESWWEHQDSDVAPPAVVSGGDLIAKLGVEQGPIVGKLLELISEAQVTGDVENQEQALELAANWLESQQGDID